MIVRAELPEDADRMGRVHVGARIAVWRDRAARGLSRIAVEADAGPAAAPIRDRILAREDADAAPRPQG